MTSSGVPSLEIQDKKNASLLGNKLPAFIVEGKTDIQTYSRLLKESELDWEGIDLVIGLNKKNIIKEHYDGLPFKYIALLDADYDIYNNNFIYDPRILYTDFYNMENYLTQGPIISHVLNDFTHVYSIDFQPDFIIDEAHDKMRPFIFACVGKLEHGWEVSLESKNIERWWDSSKNEVSHTKIKSYLENETGDQIDWKDLENRTKQILTRFSHDHILNGKHKLEVIYKIFQYYFPNEMKGRNSNAFKFDLIKYLSKSPEALNLVQQIDYKFKNIVFV